MLFVSFLRHSPSHFPEGNLVYIINDSGDMNVPVSLMQDIRRVGLRCPSRQRVACGIAGPGFLPAAVDLASSILDCGIHDTVSTVHE